MRTPSPKLFAAPRFLAAALLVAAIASPLAAGDHKTAPKPVPAAPGADHATASNADANHSDGAKAHPIELTVSNVDVDGKPAHFLSSKEPVKVGPAKLVEPAADLARGTVAVDVQAGTKDGEPVWLRLALPPADLAKLPSLLKSDDFEKLLLQLGSRLDTACPVAARQCCAKDGEGNCTRMCCGE